ncbi:2910_t:CDS:2, partial [Rhizophagus irregularis]
KQKILTAAEYNRKRAIYEYLKRLGENGKGKMKTSKEAAQLIFIDCAPYRARSIQYWANFWLQHNRLPVSRGTTTLLKFKEFVEQKLLANSGITKKKPITMKTAARWLNVLSIYYDGHERPDVVEYRKSFLDEIYSYEKYMAKYEGETMERIPPILESDDKEVILVTHDECIFYSNDGKRGVWAKSGELPLRKKGNGRSIMVSEFLLEECGRLKLNIQQHQENPFIPEEVRVYLQPGKDREGYWTSEHLINQIKTKVIPIFETLFPNCIALFAFDNSSNHAAFNPDALHQSMVNENGKPKGMKQVLIERGLWRNGLNADCQLCKDKVDDILGAAKRYARENCDYSWSSLQRVVPAALESVDTKMIRKFARKTWRYMDLYRNGIT